MNNRAPQFDLPGQEEVFNLAGETGIDGDRVSADIAQRERERKEAKEREAAQQLLIWGQRQLL